MEKLQDFLYNNCFGRIILKILIQPPVSKIGGYLLGSRISALYVNRFIKKNSIDMSDYEDRNFKSFNDFFTRKIKNGKRPIKNNPNTFISPCDGALTVYDINENSIFNIKNSVYTPSELAGFECSDFSGGKCLVFRLAVHNYHRYCFVDSGTKSDYTKIKGVFHTVMPVSADHKVFAKNTREVVRLFTDNFGEIIQIEVGALLVGKISNIKNISRFSRGDEKGMFEFGGSTIVLFVKKDAFDIRDDIIKNSLNGIETDVVMGEKISL